MKFKRDIPKADIVVILVVAVFILYVLFKK